MKIYLDTSLAMAAVTAEGTTDTVQQWLTDHAESVYCISHWMITEFHAALATRLRASNLPDRERSRLEGGARQEFDVMIAGMFVCDITKQNFEAATSLVQRSDLKLRAPDALHLAVAFSHDAALATLDRRQADAAELYGLTTIVPGRF